MIVHTMFQVQWINKTSYRIPKSFIQRRLIKIYESLRRLRAFQISSDRKELLKKNKSKKSLVIAIVSKSEIKKINKAYRGKNKFTDILSFKSDDQYTLGELILCPQVISLQAKNNKLTQREEYLYLIIHGTLHLLGYDHELSKTHEKEMFDIQDKIFSNLRK
jgi:probable rRNA maturation factor